MSELCKFCGTESEDIIQVTDTDGDKWPMCRECFDHEHNEKVCIKCGFSKVPVITHDGSLTCYECGYNAHENDYWCLPNETVKKSAVKFKEWMAKFKVNKTQCNIVAKLIRAEFDRVGTIMPLYPHNRTILNNLIQTAKGVKIGKAMINQDMIEEMENDLEDL